MAQWNVQYFNQKAFKFVIVVIFLTTGTTNTLFAKWADLQCADGTNPTVSHNFHHPFFQTNLMFIGEIMCLFAYEAIYCINKYHHRYNLPEGEQEKEKSTPLIWILPAVLDLLSTSLLYISLHMISAASFQMIRSSLILFTGLLSVLVLRTMLRAHHWIGMATIMTGLIVIACGDFESNDNSNRKAILGDALVLVSQLLTAIQVIAEEKLLKKFNVDPLKAAGWEGLFGFIIMSAAFIPMYYIPWDISTTSVQENYTHRFEDAIDAFSMMLESRSLMIACIGSVLSIAIYNFAGLTVTRKWNASSRIVLDSSRTLFIWISSFALPIFRLRDWKHMLGFHILGYFAIVAGTFVYYITAFQPFWLWLWRWYNYGVINGNGNDRQRLLGENDAQPDDLTDSIGDDGQQYAILRL